MGQNIETTESKMAAQPSHLLPAIFLLITVISPLATEKLVYACPNICSCSNAIDAGAAGARGVWQYRVINCTSRGLLTLPVIPRSVTTLDLSHNRLGPMINTSFNLQMPNLTSLDLSNNGLTRMLACTLQGMLSLKKINLRANSLQSLPDSIFADNQLVEFLDLSDNRLTNLPGFDFLRHLPKLKSLDVSNNRLTTLKLGPRFQVPRLLESLDVSNNQFTRVADDAFQAASGWAVGTRRGINLSNSGITEIAAGSLGKIPTLHGLDLSMNPGLTVGNVSSVLKELENGELEILSVSGLGLTCVVPLFSGVTLIALKSLDVSNNSIDDLPLDALASVSSLRVLDMSRNSLTSLKDGFSKLQNLKQLDLSHNDLTTFKGSPLQQLGKLRSLKLAHNRLAGDDNVEISNLVRLRHLVIHNNLLTKVPLPSNTSVLETLDIHANSITEFDGINDATSLQHFDISDNDLGILGPYLFKVGNTIKLANFSKNSLTRLDNRAFLPHSPLILDLSKNFFSEIHSPNWVATQQLDLSANRLSTLNVHTFYGMTGLLRLNISRNKLPWVHEDLFEHLDALLELDVSHNQIGGKDGNGPHEKIYWARLFRNLGQLVNLDLSYNNISTLDEHILKPLASISKLYLNNNKLATVYPRAFHDSSTLNHLDLSHNPYHCSCDLLAFRDWMSRSDIPVANIHGNTSYQCETPGSRKGFHVTAWGPDEFECNETMLYAIIFGSLGVLLIVGIVVGIGVVRLYRQRRSKRNEKRRRRTRILRELEHIRAKESLDKEDQMVLVSRQIADEIEEVLEDRKKKNATGKHGDTKEHAGAYVPWPMSGFTRHADHDKERKKNRPNDEEDLLKTRPDRRDEDDHNRPNHLPYDGNRARPTDIHRVTPSGHREKQPTRHESVPKVVRLDQHYPYIMREAVPVAEKVTWVPRHSFRDERYSYYPQPIPRRPNRPHVVMYNRGSVDSTGRPDVWTTADDYRPAKYWTMPSRSSREEIMYPDTSRHHHHRAPDNGMHHSLKHRAPSVRFEDLDYDHQNGYPQPKPGSYEYWRLYGGNRSLSQGYLPSAGRYDNDDEDRERTHSHSNSHRQYESIDQQPRGKSAMGQRAASQPQLANGNTSGWL